MNPDTPTPRTDAAQLPKYEDGSGNRLEYVPANLARTLEHENISLRLAQKICADCDAPTTEKFRQLERELAEAKKKVKAWALGVEQSNTDIVDMQRDEFRRIKALLHPPDSELGCEITSICDRAIAVIEQTVPVVIQRDCLVKDRDRWREMAMELAKEIDDIGFFCTGNALDENTCQALANRCLKTVARFNAMNKEQP